MHRDFTKAPQSNNENKEPKECDLEKVHKLRFKQKLNKKSNLFQNILKHKNSKHEFMLIQCIKINLNMKNELPGS